jgi:molybdopterin-biosynthesis enzyme MoeA-like protein
MNFGLIVVGDEILSGKRQDNHLSKVIELLAVRGLALAWARFVGDDRAAIAAVLRDALGSADAVFSCGGIGATPDDHTRQAAAEALGVPLELHPQAAELIRERMREVAAAQGEAFDPDRPDNLHRLNMGLFPRGAQIVPNPYNRIPGFSIGDVHFVPGFPVMAWPMIEWLLDTRYAALHRAVTARERSVIVRGSTEAALTPLMADVEARFAGVKVFSLPCVDDAHRFGRHIELGVKGPPAELDAAYAALRDGLQRLQATVGPELVR